jgi:hypothetical protein
MLRLRATTPPAAVILLAVTGPARNDAATDRRPDTCSLSLRGRSSTQCTCFFVEVWCTELSGVVALVLALVVTVVVADVFAGVLVRGSRGTTCSEVNRKAAWCQRCGQSLSMLWLQSVSVFIQLIALQLHYSASSCIRMIKRGSCAPLNTEY